MGEWIEVWKTLVIGFMFRFCIRSFYFCSGLIVVLYIDWLKPLADPVDISAVERRSGEKWPITGEPAAGRQKVVFQN